MVKLYTEQKEAVEKLSSGHILCAGVGVGKSITALAYYYVRECKGSIRSDGSLVRPSKPMNLYIITTARKRDTKEWEEEIARFDLFDESLGILVVVDSWNNIAKYEKEQGFYIFDEQRVIGSGKWVRSFLRIAKRNRWILLSATPGDTWLDYIPVFIANGFYKNRTEFLSRHAVYNRYSKYPKIDRFVECGRLEKLRRQITVVMKSVRHTVPHHIYLTASYDKKLYDTVAKDRWNPFTSEPIRDISGVCYLTRRVVNSDPSRLDHVRELMGRHPRLIIFYNHDHELDALRTLGSQIEIKEWNGHKHQPVPNSDRWLYLVQYTAGAEAWNCVATDAIIFFSQNYSYKMMTQAAGRIDRRNSPYTHLYYYHIRSTASIDILISKALKEKRDFNVFDFEA